MIKKYLQAALEICLYLFLHPIRSLRVFRHQHDTVKGMIFADRFSQTGPTASSISIQPSPPNSLEKYFDSHTEGPGIFKWRHYFDIYDRHLKKFVGSEVNLAEVGVYSGGSLDMWTHYFGPQCKIYGIDIEEACRVYEKNNIRIFIGDQKSRSFWQDFRSKIPALDILIDDGGHTSAQQIVTLEETLPHLRPGGVFICEDIHGRYHGFEAYLLGLLHELNAAESERTPGADYAFGPTSFQKFIYSIHRYPYITVIEKNIVPLERLVAPRRGTQWQPFTFE